ncbi:MAG: hypothetical protein Q7V57_11080 [Actinomycetota bacterium]|nr:hypothetical protein [Actinomycetota bacterium]
MSVHETTAKHVFIGAAAEVEALLPALDDAIRLGVPLRLMSHCMSLEDLRRVQSVAVGYLPMWVWVWVLPSGTNRSADLLHLDPDQLPTATATVGGGC